MSDLTAQQLIKVAVLERLDVEGTKYELDYLHRLKGGCIDDAYSHEEEENYDYVYDVLTYEIREGEVETNIPSPSSRHYETKSVAMKVKDQWVGWTYWYGGGKHGEPESIEWIDDAYLLDCVEEQVTVTKRTFTKRG